MAPGSASSPWHWAGQLLPGEWCLGRGSTPPPQLGRHTAESRSAQGQGRLRAANIRTTGCSLPPACLRLQPRRRAEVLRSREQGLESPGLSAGTWARLLLLEDRWGPRAEAQGPSDSGGGCLPSARCQGPGAHPGKSTWPKCRRAPLTHRPTTVPSVAAVADRHGRLRALSLVRWLRTWGPRRVLPGAGTRTARLMAGTREGVQTDTAHPSAQSRPFHEAPSPWALLPLGPVHAAGEAVSTTRVWCGLRSHDVRVRWAVREAAEPVRCSELQTLCSPGRWFGGGAWAPTSPPVPQSSSPLDGWRPGHRLPGARGTARVGPAVRREAAGRVRV